MFFLTLLVTVVLLYGPRHVMIDLFLWVQHCRRKWSVAQRLRVQVLSVTAYRWDPVSRRFLRSGSCTTPTTSSFSVVGDRAVVTYVLLDHPEVSSQERFSAQYSVSPSSPLIVRHRKGRTVRVQCREIDLRKLIPRGSSRSAALGTPIDAPRCDLISPPPPLFPSNPSITTWVGLGKTGGPQNLPIHYQPLSSSRHASPESRWPIDGTPHRWTPSMIDVVTRDFARRKG